MITGTSRGFGALIAAEALAAGDAVVATARKTASIPVSIRDHPNALPVALDVQIERQATDSVRAAVDRFGAIDILVNNAGYGFVGAVEETNAAEVDAIFRTNVFGVLNVTRSVLPPMRAQRSGHILNLSSIGGYAASAGFGIYCATKFAVEAISEAMSLELEPLGIRTTVIEPGYFRTTFLSDESIAGSATRIDAYRDTVGAVRRFVQGADGQQSGDPKRLAEAIVRLVNAKDPPRRLPVGSDAIARIERKHRDVGAQIAASRPIALSTDFVGDPLTD
jgi:NADP-dependent 3-hydroxy acid dehydrogenase YdfG